MTYIDKLNGISIGDEVICTKKSYACYGEVFKVTKIEIDAGARNGWFHGDKYLLAGEEITKVRG
jgi:hypothetical protein